MRKVIVDCDAGMDDASALFLATKAHKVGMVQLLAVTTVDGNTTLNNVVKNVARTLTTVGMNDIPIFRGAHSAFVEHVADDPWHGSDGFGDSTHDDEEPNMENVQREHAVQALIRLVAENPGEISLVTLGPLTNIAMAMRLDQQFASNLKELYIMGGNVQGVGNTTVSAEFNFHTDAESAYVVLENTRCPTYIASWELCLHGTKVDWSWREKVYAEANSPQSRLIDKIEAKLVAKKVFETYVVCDLVAMAAFIDPRLMAQTSFHYVTVELHGRFTRGQMVVDYSKMIVGKQANVHLIDSLDTELFRNIILWTLDHPKCNYSPIQVK